ncbi:MAG: hypothetical protein Q7T49_01750 [bacterium]|nr:hypothetical protein [bacterium]
MESEFKTSFIPKQALVQSPVVAQRPISLVSTISFVILILSLLLAGGTYGYERLLASEITRPCPDPNQTVTQGCGLKASLDKEKKALDEGLLTEFKRLAAKLNLANVLLDKHVTVLPVFDLLSKLTLETVRYTSLDYNNVTINISGVAQSYEDIAVQSNVFDRERLIPSFIFSDLNLDNEGNVVFKLVINLDSRLLKYSLAAG